MIITLSAIGFIVLGFVFLFIHHKTRDYSDGWFGGSVGCFVIGGIILISSFVAMAGKEMCANAYVVRYEAVQLTMDEARNNESITQFELAAIQQKAVEKNEALASLRYWATHPLCNWFYGKKILEIQPIK